MSLGVDLLRRSAMRNAMALSAIFIVVLTLCGFWMLAEIRSEVRDDIDAQLQLAHDDLSDITDAELRDWFEDQDDFLLFSEGYRAADGTVLGALRPEVFDQPGYQTMPTDTLFQPRFTVALDRLYAELGIDEEMEAPLDIETWRVFVGPAASGDLAVFEPISGVEEALGLIPRVVATVGVALVLTTLASGALMAWRQQARLDRVRDGIARIGRGDLSHRMAPAHPRDDLDEIMLGIDTAAAELDGSISRLRLFSQNVAHELRTPLARLRATLEDCPTPSDAALERTDEVIRTLDAVQRIARLSHQPDPGTLSPVPLQDVAVLAEELFSEVAAEAGQKLDVRFDNPAVVQGDFQLLAQMLSNLVENAIRYAGDGAQITIHAAGLRLGVHDTGPGITSADDMTEPFARSAEARATAGTGLGLALVKTIARYHGAELTLLTRRGLKADVVFPEGQQ